MESDAQVISDISDNVLMVLPLFRRKLTGGSREKGGKRAPYLEPPILGMLMRGGPLPMSEISQRLNVSKPNMTYIIDRMIKEGKVARNAGTEDRRIVEIRITDRGRRFMQEHRKAVKEAVKRNVSGLGSRDLRILCESLDNMRMIVSKIED